MSNTQCILHFYGTPPFPPDSCYLSGAPCQTIIRQLSDACQMSHQTSVNSHQTSVRQVPHMYHMPTRHILCHMYTRRPPEIYQTSTTHLSDVWYLSGVYVVLVWQMFGESWQTSGETSDRHLAIIWQSSDREHPTNSNCLVETVVYIITTSICWISLQSDDWHRKIWRASNVGRDLWVLFFFISIYTSSTSRRNCTIFISLSQHITQEFSFLSLWSQLSKRKDRYRAQIYSIFWHTRHCENPSQMLNKLDVMKWLATWVHTFVSTVP